MNNPDAFVRALVANLARNLAQSSERYAARHGSVFQGSERVATAKSGTFARKIAYTLNNAQQATALLKAFEAIIGESAGQQLVAIRGAFEGDGGRTRIGNTPTCEDCGQPQDHCECEEEIPK